MKRLIVVVLALALSVAIGSAALASKGGRTTKVKIEGDAQVHQGGNPPYNEGSSFHGKVKGKKARRRPARRARSTAR